MYKEQSPGFDQKSLQAQDLSNRSSSYEHRAHKEASLVHSQMHGRSGDGPMLPNPPQAHSHHPKDVVRGPELYRYPSGSNTPHKSDMSPYREMPEKSVDSSNIPALKPNSQHGPASYGAGPTRAYLSKVVAPGPPPLIKEPSRYPSRGSKVAQPPPHVGGSIVQGLPVVLNSTSPAGGGSISMGTPRYDGHRQPTPPARSDAGSISKGTPKLVEFSGRSTMSIDQNSFRMPHEGHGGIPIVMVMEGGKMYYRSLEEMYQERPQSAGYHHNPVPSGYSSGPTSSGMYHEIPSNSSAKEVLMGDYMTAKQMNSQGKEGQMRASEKDSHQPSMSPGSRDAYGRETSKATCMPPENHLPLHLVMQQGRTMNCKDVGMNFDPSAPGQRTMFLNRPPGQQQQQYVLEPATSRGNLQMGGSVQDRIHSPRGSSDSGLRTQPPQLANQRQSMADHESHSHHAAPYHHSVNEGHVRTAPDERESLPHQHSALPARLRPQSAQGARGDQDMNGPREDSGGGDPGDGGKNSENSGRASQKQLTAANLIDIIITEQINQDALDTKPPQTTKILDQLSHSDVAIMGQASSQRSQVSPSPPSSMAAPYKPFQNRNIGPADVERSNQLEAFQSKAATVKREDNSNSQSYQQHIGGGGGGNQHPSDGANRPSQQSDASNSAMTITLGQHIDQIIIQDYKLIENIPGAMTSVNGE